jgi:hypothetical protein
VVKNRADEYGETGKRRKKTFFFEKKNQKTFDPLVRAGEAARV